MLFWMALVLVSCTSTKVATTDRKHDKVEVKKQLNLYTKTVTPAIQTELQVFDPCEGQGEILNTKIGNQQVKLIRDGTKLKLEALSDSIVSVFDKRVDTVYKTETIREYQDVEVTVYKPPTWAWYSILGNVLLIAIATLLTKKAFF